jgi:replicative DNA helicase
MTTKRQKAKQLWGELRRCEPSDFIEECYLNEELPMSTGIATLDLALGGGLQTGICEIMGNPGSSKSALALCIACHTVANYDQPALYFSLEMNYKQCRYRAMSWLAATYADETGLIPFEWSKPYEYREKHAEGEPDPIIIASKAFDEVLGSKLRIIDDVRSISDIREIVDTLCDGGLKPLVVIDYVQIVDAPDASTEYERISEVSRELASLAEEHEIPLLAISSMNREASKGENKKNGTASNAMHGGRGSGQLEFDATIVIRLVRKDNGGVSVTVPKNRKGDVMNTPKTLHFDGKHHVYRYASIGSDSKIPI